MARHFEELTTEPKRGKIMFRIRQVYYNLIVKGEKHEEIRRASPYWMTFLDRDPRPTEAIFVSGKRSHHRQIMGIDYVKEGGAFVLGRPLSTQGLEDIGSGPVVVFRLGPEIK